MKSKTIKVSKEWRKLLNMGCRAFNMTGGEIIRASLKWANNGSHDIEINSDYSGEIVFKFQYNNLYGLSADEIKSIVANRILQHDLMPNRPEFEAKEHKDYIIEK